MTATNLYRRYTLEELTDMSKAIREDPVNQLDGSFYLYTATARKKLDAIAWAITYHLQDKRCA